LQDLACITWLQGFIQSDDDSHGLSTVSSGVFLCSMYTYCKCAKCSCENCVCAWNFCFSPLLRTVMHV
jgi:hypothetical protein